MLPYTSGSSRARNRRKWSGSPLCGVAVIKQVVVGHLREGLAQPVGVGLAVLAAGAHLVGFVDDDQIPARAEQAFAGVLDERDPRDRRDDLVAFLPGVLAVVGPQHVAADDVELLAELVGQLALPLEGEVGRRDDQHAPDQPAGLEFLEQQARHDRLAGPGVVGQEEADAGQLQEIAVDRFELVRQRIDAGNGQGEERVVFVGQAEAMGLDAEAEQPGVAVERLLVGGNGQVGKLVGREDGSCVRPVCRPRPMILSESPSGTTARTSTGSGKVGPRTMLPMRMLFGAEGIRDGSLCKGD